MIMMIPILHQSGDYGLLKLFVSDILAGCIVCPLMVGVVLFLNWLDL